MTLRWTRRDALAGGLCAAVAGARAGRADPGPGWTPRAAMPAPAQEIYPALWRGRVYVAGGFTVADGALGATARCFAYDPWAGAWD